MGLKNLFELVNVRVLLLRITGFRTKLFEYFFVAMYSKMLIQTNRRETEKAVK